MDGVWTFINHAGEYSKYLLDKYFIGLITFIIGLLAILRKLKALKKEAERWRIEKNPPPDLPWQLKPLVLIGNPETRKILETYNQEPDGDSYHDYEKLRVALTLSAIYLKIENDEKRLSRFITMACKVYKESFRLAPSEFVPEKSRACISFTIMLFKKMNSCSSVSVKQRILMDNHASLFNDIFLFLRRTLVHHPGIIVSGRKSELGISQLLLFEEVFSNTTGRLKNLIKVEKGSGIDSEKLPLSFKLLQKVLEYAVPFLVKRNDYSIPRIRKVLNEFVQTIPPVLEIAAKRLTDPDLSNEFKVICSTGGLKIDGIQMSGLTWIFLITVRSTKDDSFKHLEKSLELLTNKTDGESEESFEAKSMVAGQFLDSFVDYISRKKSGWVNGHQEVLGEVLKWCQGKPSRGTDPAISDLHGRMAGCMDGSEDHRSKKENSRKCFRVKPAGKLRCYVIDKRAMKKTGIRGEALDICLSGVGLKLDEGTVQETDIDDPILEIEYPEPQANGQFPKQIELRSIVGKASFRASNGGVYGLAFKEPIACEFLELLCARPGLS